MFAHLHHHSRGTRRAAVLGIAAAFTACADGPAGLATEELDAQAVDGPSMLAFQSGVAPTAAYAGATDTVLAENQATTNAGRSGTVQIDRDVPSGSGQSEVGLLRFDLTALPATAVVSAATLSVTVTNQTSGAGYSLFAASRTWSETEATWRNAAAGAAWASAGARGASDHATTVLGTLLPTAVGAYTINLNAAGVAVVQAWVNTPSSNHGFVIDAATNQDGLGFASSDATPASTRPRLVVSYEAPTTLDPDGVQMLFPSAPGGASFFLGTRDATKLAPTLTFEGNLQPTAQVEDNLRFWRSPMLPLTYDNGTKGLTGRWHIHATATAQRFTWLTQHGFLAQPNDLKNQEVTAYVRVRGLLPDQKPLQGIHLKLRGGRHTSEDGDLAACVMMEYRPTNTGSPTRFGKELHHPDYDYVSLTPRVSGGLVEERWVGLKMVSYNEPGNDNRVVNRLYVDVDPFTADGRPANHWQLDAEYIDIDGVDTGLYHNVVNWGGYRATLRLDALTSYDVAIFSAREIVP